MIHSNNCFRFHASILQVKNELWKRFLPSNVSWLKDIKVLCWRINFGVLIHNAIMMFLRGANNKRTHVYLLLFSSLQFVQIERYWDCIFSMLTKANEIKNNQLAFVRRSLDFRKTSNVQQHPQRKRIGSILQLPFLVIRHPLHVCSSIKPFLFSLLSCLFVKHAFLFLFLPVPRETHFISSTYIATFASSYSRLRSVISRLS